MRTRDKMCIRDRYIARLSMRELYDEYGNPHLCVDEELRRRLETKLITKLLTFREMCIRDSRNPVAELYFFAKLFQAFGDS